MHEFIWQAARVLLLVLLIVYLPIFWVVVQITEFLRALQDAVDIKLLQVESEKRNRRRARL